MPAHSLPPDEELELPVPPDDDELELLDDVEPPELELLLELLLEEPVTAALMSN